MNSNILSVTSFSFVLSFPISTVGLIQRGGTGIIETRRFLGSGGELLDNKYFQ